MCSGCCTREARPNLLVMLKGQGASCGGSEGLDVKTLRETAGSARSVGGLVVLDAGFFAGFFEFAAEGFDGGDFVVEGDVGAAVGVVEGGAEKDVDVGALHEEGAVQQLVGAGAQVQDVVRVAGDAFVQLQGVLEGDDAFGGEVHAVDAAHVGHVGVAGALDELEGLAEVVGYDLAGGAAADDVFAAFGEEEAQRSFFIVAAGWRTHDDVGGVVGTEAQHGNGAVVAKLAVAHGVAAFVEQGGGDSGAVAYQVGAGEEGADVLNGPAIDGADANAGVGDAVAHHEQEVAALDAQGAFMDFLVAHEAHLALGGQRFAVAKDNAGRVAVFDKKELVAFDLGGGEGGVGHAALLAEGQRGGDGVDAFGQGQAVFEQAAEDGGGDGGHDVGLDAAAHAVRKDGHRLLAGVAKFGVEVAAEAFAVVVVGDDGAVEEDVLGHCFSHCCPP